MLGGGLSNNSTKVRSYTGKLLSKELAKSCLSLDSSVVHRENHQ